MAWATVTGYCWPQSVEAGGTVALHLSSSGGRPVAVEVARIGAERTLVFAEAAVDAAEHPTPVDAASNGCAWPAALTITVDASWRSGYYEVVLEIDVDGKRRRSHAFFVVRPKVGARSAPILLVLATNTWHAYNDFGGWNLYTGATTVSLQRPMAPGYLFKPPGAGRRVTTTNPPDPQMATHVGYLQLNHLSPYAGSAGWPDWELPFVEWAEREGYAFDVATNADLDDHPDLLSGYRLMLSVGHDEYWSGAMRDSVERFVATGGNVAFFSGNTSFWQVRLEDTTPEGPARSMIGFKGRFKDDPCFDTDRARDVTSMWSDYLLGRPENHMTGVSFARGGYHRIGKRVTNGSGAYTIHRPDHWLFAGTGIGYGDLLGAGVTVVGYECDGCDFTYRDGLPTPPAKTAPRSTSRSSAPRRPHTSRATPRPGHRNRTSRRRSSSSRRACSTAVNPPRSSGSPPVTRFSVRTRRPAAERSSPPAPPTGRTGSPAAIRRSSRSPATCSTACRADRRG